MYCNHLAADSLDVFCSISRAATAWGTKSVNGAYPTKSLEATTAFSTAAIAFKKSGRPAATGSNLLEKKAVGRSRPPCSCVRTDVIKSPLKSTICTNYLVGSGIPSVGAVVSADFSNTKSCFGL